MYKASLATHIVVSAGWLGVALAKLVLGVVAVTSGAPGAAASLYAAMDAVNIAFPPLAVATFISGVALSLGTRWGLLRHVWVVTKLALTVGVIVSAVQIGGRVQPAIGALARSAVESGTLLGLSAPPVALVMALGVAHVIMLGAAVVLSVYKPGGRTWLGRRGDAAPPS